MIRTLSTLSALAFALALLAAPARPAPPEGAPTAEGNAAARLRDLFAREWEHRLREDPLFATSVGRHEWDDRLPSAAPADLERRAAAWRGFLGELDAIDRARLSPPERASAGMLRRQLRDRIADYEMGDDQMPFNADSGFHTDFAQLPDDVPLQTAKDYDHYIARLRAWPRYVGEQIEQMRRGLARGMTVPRAVLDGYEGTISAHVVDDPTKS